MIPKSGWLVNEEARGYNSKMREKPLQKRRLYTGKAVGFCVDTVRMPSGKKALREYLLHPGAVGALAFLDRSRVVLVRQYRYPVGKVTLEIPAGKLAAGENPANCMKRELEEETGYRAGRLKKILTYFPSTAFMTERMTLYLATRLKPTQAHPDEDEFIQRVTMPWPRLLRLVLSGKIRDSKTIIAVLYFAQIGGLRLWR